MTDDCKCGFDHWPLPCKERRSKGVVPIPSIMEMMTLKTFPAGMGNTVEPRESKPPTNSEIGAQIATFLGSLQWFHGNGITINLQPTADGWSAKFSIPE